MHNTEALNASITPAAVVGWVSLPTATVEAVEVLPQQEARENSSNQDLLKTSRIMIVDDEQLVIRVVRRFLSSDGYSNFLTLTHPRDVMEQMKSYQPDIVLLDIMMPHLSGIDILKLRQQDDRIKHIPFIILSANSEKSIKRDALTLVNSLSGQTGRRGRSGVEGSEFIDRQTTSGLPA